MRRTPSLLLIVLSLLPSVASAFSDIDGSLYRRDIEALEREGLLGGYSDGTFRPKAKVNRAELLKVAMGSRPGITTPRRRCFADVSLSAWYAAYVCEAKQRRVVKGYEGNTFRPEAEVNFAEALSIILRAERIAVPQGEDVWYEPYVEFAHTHAIVSRHSYKPWDLLTRERMAQIMNGVRRHQSGDNPEQPDSFLSPGCGGQAPSKAPTSLDVGGVQRSFLIDLPVGYSSSEPMKLIVAFHGRTNSNDQVRGYYGLTTHAKDYLVVYPAALKNGSSFSWKATNDGDYLFFDRIVQTLSERYCLDMDEIYVVGHSLGAWFANSLSCARGDVIRGAGTLGGGTTNAECTGPVASMVLHNPNDQHAAFSTGIQARDLHLKQNSCGEESAPTEPREFLCMRYAGCTEHHPVVWCPHEINNSYWDNQYYPHNWPRDTGKHIIEFFESLD